MWITVALLREELRSSTPSKVPSDVAHDMVCGGHTVGLCGVWQAGTKDIQIPGLFQLEGRCGRSWRAREAQVSGHVRYLPSWTLFPQMQRTWAWGRVPYGFLIATWKQLLLLSGPNDHITMTSLLVLRSYTNASW